MYIVYIYTMINRLPTFRQVSQACRQSSRSEVGRARLKVILIMPFSYLWCSFQCVCCQFLVYKVFVFSSHIAYKKLHTCNSERTLLDHQYTRAHRFTLAQFFFYPLHISIIIDDLYITSILALCSDKQMLFQLNLQLG